MSMPVGRKGRFVTDPCCAAYKVDTGKSQMVRITVPGGGGGGGVQLTDRSTANGSISRSPRQRLIES